MFEDLHKYAAQRALDEYRTFDKQVERELAKIKFRGGITPQKVKRHGFKVVHQQGVGLYLTKNGVRVTDIFMREREI